jgi:D-cysteine desulfhydrase
VAAQYLGLDCHLILRNSRALADADPGLTGNLLVARLAGAEVHQVRTLQDCILVCSLRR